EHLVEERVVLAAAVAALGDLAASDRAAVRDAVGAERGRTTLRDRMRLHRARKRLRAKLGGLLGGLGGPVERWRDWLRAHLPPLSASRWAWVPLAGTAAAAMAAATAFVCLGPSQPPSVPRREKSSPIGSLAVPT